MHDDRNPPPDHHGRHRRSTELGTSLGFHPAGKLYDGIFVASTRPVIGERERPRQNSAQESELATRRLTVHPVVRSRLGGHVSLLVRLLDWSRLGFSERAPAHDQFVGCAHAPYLGFGVTG